VQYSRDNHLELDIVFVPAWKRFQKILLMVHTFRPSHQIYVVYIACSTFRALPSLLLGIFWSSFVLCSFVILKYDIP